MADYLSTHTGQEIDAAVDVVSTLGPDISSVVERLDDLDDEVESITSTAEYRTNKVTAISSSSTDIQYPSAKCVYDELEDKQDVLPTPVTDRYLHVDSNGDLEWSAVSGFESTSNKVTALSSASTDTQYPSAKCVYDALEDKQDTLPSPITDRYLHVDSNGDLEWSTVSGGGGSGTQLYLHRVDYSPADHLTVVSSDPTVWTDWLDMIPDTIFAIFVEGYSCLYRVESMRGLTSLVYYNANVSQWVYLTDRDLGYLIDDDVLPILD